MENIVCYDIEIKDEYSCFYNTVSLYQDVVSFLISVANNEYELIKDLKSKEKMNTIERIVHSTSLRDAKYPAFDKKFFKFPSYLRRSAIETAIGAVESYKKNIAIWDSSDKKKKKPRLNVKRYIMPCFYKGNMFTLREDATSTICRIKLFIRNDWIWKSFRLRKTDIDSIKKKGFLLEDAMCPVLKKKGKLFAFSLAFKTFKSELSTERKRILSCDIGVNNAAVISIMEESGTVIGRKFIKFPKEEDRLNSTLGKIKKAHSNSFCHTNRLNRAADNYNETLAIKTSTAIVKMAVQYSCSVIVMEKLSSFGGGKYGSKAMRLSRWRKMEVEKRVERLAHREAIRFPLYVQLTHLVLPMMEQDL